MFDIPRTEDILSMRIALNWSQAGLRYYTPLSAPNVSFA
jgi:hypothetical protein